MRFFMPRTGLPTALFLILLACIVGLNSGCHKKTPEERFQEAVQLLNENQIPLGVLKMKDLIAQNPDAPIIPDVRLVMAQVYLSLGRDENVDNAVEQLNKVIEEVGYKDQRAWNALQNLIQIHLSRDELDQAMALADDGVKKTESDPDGLSQMKTLRGTIQMTSEDEAVRNEAVEYFHDVMLHAETPDYRGQARELLAEYYRRVDELDNAIKTYQEFLDAFPDDPVNPVLMMTQAIDMKRAGKDATETDPLFEKGSELQKKRVEDELDLRERAQRLNEIALLYATYGRMAEAEDFYRRIMKEEPMSRDAINAQFAIGRLYLSAGEFDKAEQLFNQIKNENPNSNVSATADQYLQGSANMRAQLAASDAETSGTAKLEPTAGPGAADAGEAKSD